MAVEERGGLLPTAGNNIIKSAGSRTFSYVRFENRTSRVVDVIWINYEGVRVKYKTLEPYEFFDANTFVSHPWIFRDAMTREHMVAVTPPKTCQSIYRPAPWYERYVPDLKSGRLHPSQLAEIVPERVMAYIRYPLLSLRDSSLHVVRKRLEDPKDAFKLELPSILQREIADWTDELQ